MNAPGVRDAIEQAIERLLDGNPLNSDGKLTIKSLAVEAGVPRHQLTEVHTDLKDRFYARIGNLEAPPPALLAERTRRQDAEKAAAAWKARALAAEAKVEDLVRALHVVTAQRSTSRNAHLELVPVVPDALTGIDSGPA
jgi:hypothetical protein